MGISSRAKEKIVGFCEKTIEIALYVLIFCLPFSKALIEIAATFMIFAWLLKRSLTGAIGFPSSNIFTRFKPISTYLNLPIALYIITTFISVILSNNFSLSLKNFFSKIMEYIFLYFIVAECVSTRRMLKNTFIILFISAGMIGIDCLFQSFFGFDFLRLRTMEAERITGSFQMPGDLAAYLEPALCLLLSFWFLRFKKGISYWLRMESILLLVLLVASLSRAGWLGFSVGVCFLGSVENKKILFVVFATFLISMITQFYLLKSPVNIIGHLRGIFSFSDFSSLDRKDIWLAALRMIKDKPLFGHGLSTFMGNFTRYCPDYYYYLKHSIIPYAHNCYLQMAAESGLFGLASFLYLIVKFFVHTVASLKKIKDGFFHAALSGISAGIIALLVHAAFDTTFYSLQLIIFFWIMLAINAGLQEPAFDNARQG